MRDSSVGSVLRWVGLGLLISASVKNRRGGSRKLPTDGEAQSKTSLPGPTRYQKTSGLYLSGQIPHGFRWALPADQTSVRVKAPT